MAEAEDCIGKPPKGNECLSPYVPGPGIGRPQLRCILGVLEGTGVTPHPGVGGREDHLGTCIRREFLCFFMLTSKHLDRSGIPPGTVEEGSLAERGRGRYFLFLSGVHTWHAGAGVIKPPLEEANGP